MPFSADDKPKLEVGIEGMRSTQSVRIVDGTGYVATAGPLEIAVKSVRRVPDVRRAGRAERPRNGFDFAIVDLFVRNMRRLPNCTVFDATLETDFFGEAARDWNLIYRDLERLPSAGEVTVSSVFEVDLQHRPIALMLSAHSDDTCRSGFQPRVPEVASLRVLIPIR